MNALTHPTTHARVQTLDSAPGDSLLGGSIHIRVRSEDTEGRFGLIEQVVPAGFPGPALHVHPDFAETFYVIDGEIAFRVGDEAHEAGPGTVAVVPAGTPHTFANPSDQPARMLVFVTPGGFERYFEALIDAVRTKGGFPSPEELATLGLAHGSVPVAAAP
jgi:quercetin dioxygenase-like cupin family protein